jgi:hypothetical protein
MKKSYSIKYIDYFAKDDPGVKIYTYTSPNFEDIHEYYKVLVSDVAEKIGYLIISMSDSFETKLKELENL